MMPGKQTTASPLVTLTSITFMVILLVDQCYTIRWLAMANDPNRAWNKTRHCSKFRRQMGLYKGQVRLCQEHLEFMPVVAHATRQAADVCQSLFADRRWNCSSIRLAPTFMADLTGGSREQAFVYALASASLTQSIAKSCSLGVSTKCNCGRLPNTPPPGEFKWGGCGDDLRYGVLFSRWFADGVFLKRKKKSKKVLMSLHNNRAGRKAVESSLQTACKCHGVSGSCSIKTCWKALADMTTVGGVLLKRYAVAVEAKTRRIKKLGGVKRLVSVSRKRLVSETDLVYCRKSPDYCLPDPSRGSVGTHGRECKKGDPGSSGCQLMCCGRGITSRVVRVRHRCDCKYYWCCYVKCKTCIKDVVVHRCR